MSAKILDFATRAALIREAREKEPEPTFSMIVAAEHERIAENARRSREAMDRLGEVEICIIPSDSEPA